MTATRQPTWNMIANIGDVDYVTYGGTLVYTDTTGVYSPEAEVIVPLDNTWLVYRYILDRCTYVNGVLSDNKYHPEHPAWFADDLASICETHGADLDDTIQQLCSNDPVERAFAYQMIGEYHGWENFDGYPMTFISLIDIEARYPEYD